MPENTQPTHREVAAHLAADPQRAAAHAGPLAVIAAASRGVTDVETLRALSRAARAQQEA